MFLNIALKNIILHEISLSQKLITNPQTIEIFGTLKLVQYRNLIKHNYNYFLIL